MKTEKDIAESINYPENWDIEKYPTLSCALYSIIKEMKNIIWYERARNGGGWCD